MALQAGAVAQQDDAASAAQANNPLANMTAFNLQNYYIGDVTQGSDSAGATHTSIGDLNLFAACLMNMQFIN